jgi:signal transduction histidine kinase
MVASMLAFLSDDAAAEQTRRLDLASVLASLAADHKDAGHAVRYGGPAHLPLRGRPLALKRAFANLIDNAIAYGGRAEVRLLATARDALVEIADEGPGIPVAAQEDVFRPFHRLDPSRSRATGGFGLGLTVARSIVRAHGGDIGLANRPTGGLAVTVSLPLGE